jgi:hypothetical protein
MVLKSALLPGIFGKFGAGLHRAGAHTGLHNKGTISSFDGKEGNHWNSCGPGLRGHDLSTCKGRASSFLGKIGVVS